MDAYSKQISRPGRHEYDDERADLADLVNVGRAVAGYFERVGITRTAQLAGRDPIELYEQMSAACGEALDPCLLDTVMSAVDQAEGRPARPWWHYTPPTQTAARRRVKHTPRPHHPHPRGANPQNAANCVHSIPKRLLALLGSEEPERRGGALTLIVRDHRRRAGQ
jgi:hypothetical protein